MTKIHINSIAFILSIFFSTNTLAEAAISIVNHNKRFMIIHDEGDEHVVMHNGTWTFLPITIMDSKNGRTLYTIVDSHVLCGEWFIHDTAWFIDVYKNTIQQGTPYKQVCSSLNGAFYPNTHSEIAIDASGNVTLKSMGEDFSKRKRSFRWLNGADKNSVSASFKIKID